MNTQLGVSSWKATLQDSLSSFVLSVVLHHPSLGWAPAGSGYMPDQPSNGSDVPREKVPLVLAQRRYSPAAIACM
jgi:hypothetical protein